MRALRNIGIVAHIDAGKTTLTERILFDAGRQSHLGDVDDGTSAMDWMPEERERGISITAAASRVEWRGHRIHLIDTPGHVDFTAEVERCLRVLDGVIVVLDGVRGVESQTITVWRQAERWGVPALVFVNKLDRPGANFAACLQSLAERLQCRPVPVVLPLMASGFRGLLDLLSGTVQWFEGEPPEATVPVLRAEAQHSFDRLVEVCAEFDDGVMAQWLEGGGVVPADRLRAVLRRACRERKLVPVLCGSALHNRGVDLLLDAVCRLLPGPDERPRTGPAGVEPRADPEAPFCGCVFKVHHAETVMNYLRVFAGTLRAGQPVRCARTGEDVGVPALWSMHAQDHEEVDLAEPGDVVVVPAVSAWATGDTLHDPHHPVSLPMIHFPPPVVAVTFEPERPQDLDAMLASLRELAADDPTLAVSIEAERGVLVVRGMGELHLEIVAERLRRRSGLRVNVGRPTVTLRYTVRHRGVGEAEVQAAFGGRVHRASARLLVGPAADSDDATAAAMKLATLEQTARPAGDAAEEVAVIAAPGLSAPPALVEAALSELHSRTREGLREGGPARALRIELSGFHAQGLAELGDGLALKAVHIAFDKALAAAELVRLEPMARFEVLCPPESLSAVMADLNSRQADVNQVASGALGALVQGSARFAALLGYATRLRSITRGMGVAQIQPDGFAPVVKSIAALEKGAEKLDPGEGPR